MIFKRMLHKTHESYWNSNTKITLSYMIIIVNWSKTNKKLNSWIVYSFKWTTYIIAHTSAFQCNKYFYVFFFYFIGIRNSNITRSFNTPVRTFKKNETHTHIHLTMYNFGKIPFIAHLKNATIRFEREARKKKPAAAS